MTIAGYRRYLLERPRFRLAIHQHAPLRHRLNLDPRRRQIDPRLFRARGLGPIALHPLASVILRHEVEIQRLARLILPENADPLVVEPHRYARLGTAAHIAS